MVELRRVWQRNPTSGEQAPSTRSDRELRRRGLREVELVRRGYSVLLPFGVNQRYDLVLDLGGRFIRAQCKTGRLRDGVVTFSTRSVRSNTRRTVVRDYRGDADVFLVYCPGTRRLYCIPIEDAPITYMYLRVEPTLNGQRNRIPWASDYELPA
jgi:hypothetical protein